MSFGRENRIGYFLWSVKISKILKIARKVTIFKKRRKKTDYKKFLKYSKYLPSGEKSLKIMKCFFRKSRVDLGFSTGDPFFDGILSGWKYAAGVKQPEVYFDDHSWFILRLFVPLSVFVKTGFIWIIDIVKKEVGNVIH